MPTTIFFNIPAHGHINSTLPVAAELVRRGERHKIGHASAVGLALFAPIPYNPTCSHNPYYL